MSVLTKLFTPSGSKFYDLFEQVTDNLNQMAELFSENIHVADRMKRRVLLDKIEKLEQKNDEATHKLFIELGRNFITPFDREDIHFMASSLDDVADNIWATAKQMYYFDIDLKGSATEEVAVRLVQYVKHLSEAIKGLRNRKDLNALIAILESMRALSSASDKRISEALSALFEEKSNPVEMIKLSDHYNMLGYLNNKCGDVINVLEGMIIKYS